MLGLVAVEPFVVCQPEFAWLLCIDIIPWSCKTWGSFSAERPYVHHFSFFVWTLKPHEYGLESIRSGLVRVLIGPVWLQNGLVLGPHFDNFSVLGPAGPVWSGPILDRWTPLTLADSTQTTLMSFMAFLISWEVSMIHHIILGGNTHWSAKYMVWWIHSKLTNNWKKKEVHILSYTYRCLWFWFVFRKNFCWDDEHAPEIRRVFEFLGSSRSKGMTFEI